jgi:hypothetical protein
VRAAREAGRAADVAALRDVSQVAVVTGLNRREVDRIGAGMAPRAVRYQSPATQVFTRWPVLALRVCSARDTCPTPGDVSPFATRPEHPMDVQSIFERMLSAIAPWERSWPRL